MLDSESNDELGAARPEQVHNAAVVARSLGCQCDTDIGLLESSEAVP